jgi:hypothetical protein
MRIPVVAIACLPIATLLAAPSRVAAQNVDAVALNAPVVPGGSSIDPPPPAPPATFSRNANGRVTVRAVRVSQPLHIDGNLDENVYRIVAPITGFIQTNPQPGAAATEQTEAWVFFDDKNLYIAGRCHDSHPERWVANELRRDGQAIIRNENFAVLLDTFYDRRNAFLFESTPIGGIYDATVTNERGPEIDWNPVWETHSGRFPGGWTVEMAVPFKSLRYKPGSSQVWGLNIRRTIRWKNEETFIGKMPQQSGSVIFMVSQAGTLVGLDVPSGSKNLEIKPYGITSLTTDRLANPPLSKKRDGNAGFDVKYGLTQNLTANFTYNTDFAQVEIDSQQVNLTRFSLFFPEKRDFFLEGQGLYDFGGTTGTTGARSNTTGVAPLLFFSRRIGFNRNRAIPVDTGGRLTGKVGRFSVGLQDVRTGDDVTSQTPPTNFLVARVKRDILRRSFIGAMYTGRSVSSLGSGSAETYGADASLGFYTNLKINAFLAKTTTPKLIGDDTSYRTQLSYTGDRYGVELDRVTVGEHFNPDVGFLSRTAFHRSYGSLRFSPRPKKRSAVRKWSYQLDYEYFTNPGGRLESRNGTADFGIEFQNSDRFSLAHDVNYELLVKPFKIASNVTIPAGQYSFWNTQANWALGNQRKVSGSLNFGYGSFYNGNRTTFGYNTGRIEVTPRFSLEPSISENWVHLPYGDFTATLLGNRCTYTFTPRMFFSGLVQYNSTNTSLSSNLRLRWEYSPGSELFVVYTDEQDTALGGTPVLKNRAFVIKVNRLLRF